MSNEKSNEMPEVPDGFTRVHIQRKVPLPDGSTYGVEAAFVIESAPYGVQLLAAMDHMVRRLDQATVDGLAEFRTAELAFAVADQVAAARPQDHR